MTRLPAHWVIAGYGVPSVCARHGEPAARRAKTQFISKPPTWAIPLVLLAVIVYVIVIMAVRKTVTVQDWPYCARCRSLRQQRLIIGLGGLTLGIVLFFVGQGVGANGNGAGALLAFAGLVLCFVGLIVTARSSWALIAGGVASRDGQFIELPKADAQFTAQVDAAAVYAQQQAQYQQQMQHQQQMQYQQQMQHQQQAQYLQQQAAYPQAGVSQPPSPVQLPDSP